jgi:hypothetical protein
MAEAPVLVLNVSSNIIPELIKLKFFPAEVPLISGIT